MSPSGAYMPAYVQIEGNIVACMEVVPAAHLRQNNIDFAAATPQVTVLAFANCNVLRMQCIRSTVLGQA